MIFQMYVLNARTVQTGQSTESGQQWLFLINEMYAINP